MSNTKHYLVIAPDALEIIGIHFGPESEELPCPSWPDGRYLEIDPEDLNGKSGYELFQTHEPTLSDDPLEITEWTERPPPEE
jgi:hypothetical protein